MLVRKTAIPFLAYFFGMIDDPSHLLRVALEDGDNLFAVFLEDHCCLICPTYSTQESKLTEYHSRHTLVG